MRAAPSVGNLIQGSVSSALLENVADCLPRLLIKKHMILDTLLAIFKICASCQRVCKPLVKTNEPFITTAVFAMRFVFGIVGFGLHLRNS